MSDTEGMVRLMEHAADKLAGRITDMAKLGRLDSMEPGQVTATVGAMAYARAVLQMTAASVAPEGAKLAQRLRDGYHAWAAEANEVGMSDGELSAVARFITSGGNP